MNETMSETTKATIWGGASVLVFAGILLLQESFANTIQAADALSGSPGTGIFALLATLMLAALFLVTATLFFRNLALGLQKRRNRAG